MKKRIICLILAVVMLSLSLVGCAYSYEDDELGKYVNFDEEAFKAALLNLSIKDGDFTEDEETRNNKVTDAVYSALAAKPSDTTKHDKGVIGEHDKVSYSYYITVKNEDGSETQFLPEYMDTSKAKTLILGQKIQTNLEKKINEVLKGYDLTDKAYSRTTSGAVDVNKLVSITYTLKYADKIVEVANDIVTLDNSNPIHKALIDKNAIGTKLDDFTIPANSGFTFKGAVIAEEITISGAKIDYAINGEPFTVTDVTYDKATALKDVLGKGEVDVNGKELIYHVYVVNYTSVDELNAANIIKLVYGKNLTKDTLKDIVLFGAGKNNATEDEQKAFLETLTISGKLDGASTDEGTIDFDTFADKLVTALSDYETKKSAQTKASDDQASAKDKYDEAVAEAEKNPSDTANEAVTSAKTKLDEMDASLKTANENFEAAVNTRDELIAAFLTGDYKSILAAKEAYNAAKNDETKAAYDAMKNPALTEGSKAAENNSLIVKGYENYKYDEFQTEYRADIKANVVKAVLEAIEKHVTIKEDVGYPKKAVDEAYDMLINKYKYNFYNGKYTDSDGKTVKNEDGVEITNYTYYTGSFKTYLVAAVSADYAKVGDYDAAKEALRAWAQEQVATVLKYSFIAQYYDEQLGLVYTDKEFKKYKKDDSNSYESKEFQHGESTVRNGLQFEKLMNHFAKTNEVVDGRRVTDTYENVTIVKN